jgi:hypothetical protein
VDGAWHDRRPLNLLLDVLSGALLAAAIAARIQAGRYARRANDDTDEVYHRSYVEVLRSSHHRLPDQFPQFIGPGRNSYPPGYHWALSFLPAGASDAIGRYGAIAGDLLLGGWVSVLLATKADLPVAGAVAVVALYLASPALTLVNIGPRSFHLTPRLPSQLLFGAICVSAITAAGHLSLTLGLVVTVLLALNLLISKFALQAAVFAIPALAVSADPAFVLGCFVGACALATLLSRGFFLRQVKGQAEHLEWYVKRQLPHMYRGMAWRELLAAIRTGNVRDAARIVIFKNPLTATLIRHLHVVAAGIWLLIEMPGLSPAQKAALAFTAAGATGWLMTSGGPLRVLGEAERYLEFVFPASWFLFWTLPDGTGLVVAIALMAIYEAAMHAGNLAIMGGKAAGFEKIRADRDAVLASLASRDRATVLFLDIKDAFAVHRLHDGICAVMFSGQMSLRGEMAGYLDWFFLRYPYVHPRHLDAIVDRYGVDVVVARRLTLDQVLLEANGGYDLAGLRPSFENDLYAVFSVPSQQGLEEHLSDKDQRDRRPV